LDSVVGKFSRIDCCRGRTNDRGRGLGKTFFTLKVHVAIVAPTLVSVANAKVARVPDVQADFVASFGSSLTEHVGADPVGESFFLAISSG